MCANLTSEVSRVILSLDTLLLSFSSKFNEDIDFEFIAKLRILRYTHKKL